MAGFTSHFIFRTVTCLGITGKKHIRNKTAAIVISMRIVTVMAVSGIIIRGPGRYVVRAPHHVTVKVMY
jgi:hypothetical protein